MRSPVCGMATQRVAMRESQLVPRVDPEGNPCKSPAHHTDIATLRVAMPPDPNPSTSPPRAPVAAAHRHFLTFRIFQPVVPADSRIAFAHVPCLRAAGPRLLRKDHAYAHHTQNRRIRLPDTLLAQGAPREEPPPHRA